MICHTDSVDRSQPNIRIARPNFEQQLRDAIAKLQITPVAIVHSDYEPLTIPDRYKNYLEQMSVADRDRYFAVRLQQYLYAIFNGDLLPKHSTMEANSQTDSDEEMANYADKWYKTQFYHQLTQCNHGRGYSDPNWLIVEREAERWQVSKNGLTLHINPEIHLVDPTLKLQVGQTVSIKMPPSLVDRGLYIAVGDAGSANNSELPVESNVVQLYFNVSAEVALLLLDCLTQQLNILKIPFDFKVAYNEASFERQDAAVLEFMSQDWTRLKPVLETVYSENRSGFQTEIPFFCKHLASGFGLAEKPNMASDREQENIGQQHCNIIAKALVKVCKHDESDLDKFDYVLSYLSEVGVDLKHLYLNPDSSATYEVELQ